MKRAMHPGIYEKLSYNYANYNQVTTNYVKMDLPMSDFSGCNKFKFKFKCFIGVTMQGLQV